MINYLIKILTLLLFSSFIILNYYKKDGPHIENFNGYFIYIIIIGFIYIIYKYFQLNLSSKKTYFTPFGILNYFLLHLFVLCFLFFYYNSIPYFGSIILFSKILFYLFLPFLIIFICIAFGKKALTFFDIPILENNIILRFLLSLGIGFFSFIFLLTTIGILGFYNLYIVFGILIFFVIFGYRELLILFDSIFTYKILLDITEGKGLRLITTEFLFLVSTLVLSISLISIVRPFPIGWDDLGVYMNYPHLLAEAGSIISLGSMFSWQVFTGIGYMFNSPVQAFFLNNVGGILSFITLVLITSDLLNISNNKKDSKSQTFINIPLLVGTIFITMPMIVFQQSKDMKLDAGLFFVSIISVYLLYKYYLYEKLYNTNSVNIAETNLLDSEEVSIIETKKNKGNDENKSFDLISNKTFFFLIIGLLVGFAFSIKLTSLLLISGIIGVIFFARMGLFGFLGYLGIYFAIFTKFNLWKMMNVVVNPGKIPFFETIFSLISAGLGLLFLVYAFYKNKGVINKFFTELLIFLLGIIIALIPWIGKNIYDAYPNISILTIIHGKTDRFNVDYTKIHSEKRIEEIINNNNRERISSSGTTSNEDFGRYFGYENGINNYIKFPWNLTMQKNQGGEFTDIGYIFLALIPLIFLFLPFKNKYYSFLILLIILLEFLIFKYGYFTDLMTQINLPTGYLFILGLFLIPLIYLNYLLKDNKLNFLFKINLVFTVFYVFLWTISAFGIVWYGITMYFSFLLMIAICFYYISYYDNNILEKDFNIKFFGSIIAFGIIFLYFLNSVFPHSFINLKNAQYPEYKLGQMNTGEAPFLYHREYLNILFELNIADDKKEQFISSNIPSDIIKGKFNSFNDKKNISLIIELLKNYQNVNNFPDMKKIPEEEKIKIQNIMNEAKISQNKIYYGILNPKDEYKNKDGIYRIGTFLKYHISENNKRLLEDSLITQFNDYIYNDDPDKAILNMQNLGLKYLLSDLNAATIDQDSEHNLTDRYEKLLKTFTSEKLELIDTDSMCLKIALYDYKINNDIDKYMNIAGVNYESYIDGKTISRGSKAMICYEYMYNLLQNNLISEDNFSYLLGLKKYYDENKNSPDLKNKVLNTIHSAYGKSFKVLFKIK